MANRAVGIDLGTTFSAIAHVNKHQVPEILHNAEGDRITPSVVLFDEDEVIVGNYAKQSAVVYPDQVVEFVKRYMGDPNFSFLYRGESYSPERISSFILSKLKHDAELRLGHRIDQAVITVPAYFGDLQRQATLRAGELAGLKVLKLINEPTAAAFAYGLNNPNSDMRVLVFDLGGGTFDVTITHIRGRNIEVIATAGDHELGGKDWDDCLINFAAEQFQSKHGLDPLDDTAAYHDLRQKCVSAKIGLTRRPKVNLFYDYKGKIMRLAVTREKFEDLTAGLLRRCQLLVYDCLDDAGLRADDIDTVLLAGGSTRMPMVREMLKSEFNRAPATDINPDECVALGAALTAAIEAAREDGREPDIDIVTHDVTSHSLGMVVFRDGQLHNSRIISRNSRIPCEHTRDDYITTHDGQTTMDLWLVQGENEDPLECTVLGHFEFYGITARAAGESRLAVTYRYNSNGIVEVEAMDLRSGQTLAHRLAADNVKLEDLAHNRVPTQVALIVDCSGSMYGTSMEDAQKAARSFVERSLTPGRQIAIVAFPGGVMTPPTADLQRVFEAIDALTPIGSTPMGQGLRDARDLLRPRAGVQRVFVIMTDGHPDDPDEVSTEIHRIRTSGGRVVTIGVGSLVQQDYLRSLASRPADYHFCNESVELEGTFINLATELTANQ
ncbi:MAG: Hsp70 family protein [Alphaproteobacteria bacterium]|nr:Hsp70 family protein [Alphaproteobacteria bacterium]MCB9791645.1 Hsp70 family protein [Alphaproteobacteria bacterium]